jgi:hypothetical protein
MIVTASSFLALIRTLDGCAFPGFRGPYVTGNAR